MHYQMCILGTVDVVSDRVPIQNEIYLFRVYMKSSQNEFVQERSQNSKKLRAGDRTAENQRLLTY